MVDTLAHSFDCECIDCTAADTAALGMSIFRKSTPAAKPAVAVISTPTVKTEPTRRLPAGQKVGRGRVRTISSRQEGFINKLINERDLTDLKLVTGQSIDPMEIPFMGVKGASALIDKLMGLPYKGTNSPVATVAVTNGIPASEKQINFIKSLADRKGFNLAESLIGLTKSSASRMIETLMNMNDKPREVANPAETKSTTNTAALTEGMYRKADGTIYKVAYTRTSGQLVAYKWELFATSEPTAKGLKFGEFVYEGKRPLYSLTATDKLSLEEAKAMGAEFHYCVRCGIELTKQSSIDQGIGPICASKF
jgi:hypothetical protein